VVVISGDLANGEASTPKGFAEFGDFVKPLRELVGPENVVVVPGNHDVPKDREPGDPSRYTDFLDVTRKASFVTPLLDGEDFDRRGKLNDNALEYPHLVRGDDFLVIPFNSSHFCWGTEPFDGSILEDLVTASNDEEVIKAAKKLRQHDVPRISNAQIDAVQALLHQREPRVMAGRGDDPRVRFAVLHHQLLPVSTREEFKAFESLTNLGAVRALFMALDIHVVLHGHKHESTLYWDYVAQGTGLDQAPRRMLVSAAPGEFGPRKVALRLFQIGDRADARDLRIEDVSAAPGPAAALGRSHSWARLWRQPEPDSVAAATVIRGRSVSETYAKIQSLFEDRRDGEPIHDLLCEVTEPSDSVEVPTDYSRPSGVEDLDAWMRDLVDWWQLPDPQLLQRVTFNHGNRIYRRFGDQVERAASALADSSSARAQSTRGIITLIDPRDDGGVKGDFPSFVFVQLQLVWNQATPRLDCTGYFRKQEMRYWWPINVAELERVRGAVLEKVAERHPVRAGVLRTITAFAAVEEELPTVALAIVDRAIDQHPEDLWRMAYSVVHGSRRGRRQTRATWSRYLADLDPSTSPPSSDIQISYRGLHHIGDMLKWLGAEKHPVAKMLGNLVGFYDVLADQPRSGEAAIKEARKHLEALNAALDKELEHRSRIRRPIGMKFSRLWAQ